MVALYVTLPQATVTVPGYYVNGYVNEPVPLIAAIIVLFMVRLHVGIVA